VSIPRDFIELLLARIDLVDFIGQLVPLKKKTGSNYFARCPFHQEKSASFSVSQTKQFYYCFGCGAHGNAIDFLMNHDHLSFPEAVENLARTANMEVPRTNNAPAPKKDDSLPALYELTQQVSAYFYEHMCNSTRAIDYLKKRGITGNIAKQFQIGYAPNGWSHALDQFGKTELDKKKLLDTGLIIKKDEGGYYDRFRDRIMFPILDHRGRIIGFGGRVLGEGEPKYLNSPETPIFQKGHELYGLFQGLKANRELKRVMIVEGYLDVIALFQHGITYAVATLGTATTPHHLQRLFRYTNELVFCFDGDNAGRTAAWRALQVIFPLMHDSLQVRFLFLPDGEDPDSLVHKEGKEAFEKRIDTSLSLSDFFFQSIAQQADMNTMEGRARFASLSLNHIKQLPPSLFHNMMLDALAKRARIDVTTLKSDKKIPEATTAPTLEKIKLPAPLQLAAALLLQAPTLAQSLEPLPEYALPGYAFLIRLIDQLKAKASLTAGAFLELFRGSDDEPLITQCLQFDHCVPDEKIEAAFQGAMRQVHALGMDLGINALMAKAAQSGLSEEERQQLTQTIAKRKALPA
jgi:DNA primase